MSTTNGLNGWEANGRFAPGNAGGPGNPLGRRTAELRSAMLNAVTDDDIRAIIKNLVASALGGDVMAAREVLNRTVGRAPAYEDQMESAAVATSPEDIRANGLAVLRRLGILEPPLLTGGGPPLGNQRNMTDPAD